MYSMVGVAVAVFIVFLLSGTAIAGTIHPSCLAITRPDCLVRGAKYLPLA
jgi:hypothetical protein